MRRTLFTGLFFFLCFVFVHSSSSYAQDIILNNSTHGTTRSTCSGYLYDNSKTGNYEPNQDRWITICPAGGSNNTRIALTFTEFDIDPSDKVYIYQGSSITDAPLNTSDNIPYFQGNDLLNEVVMPTLMAPTGCLTVRLETDGANEAGGFKAEIECVPLCQFPQAALDTFFIKYDVNGNMSTRPVRDGVDTVYDEDGNMQISYFKSIDICEGDSVVILANPKFPEYDPNNSQTYEQDTADCIYEWTFGDGESATVSYNRSVGHFWEDVDGYDLVLVVEDTNNGGCRSKNTIDTRIRVAKNPIKTVIQLPDMCSGTEMGLAVGYDVNSSVIIDSLYFNRSAKERNENRTFIPDGDACGADCYDAPVVFDQFRAGSTIGSVDDIMAICVNMEHSFLGDLALEIVCPTGQKATLMFKTSNGGTFMGQPNETDSYADECDSNQNPYGVGWTYCFSNQYLDGAYGTMRSAVAVGNTLPATDTAAHSGYYQTPQQGSSPNQNVDLNGFAPLIGCPLNGEWSIRVCDTWGADNGYVFWWDMELGQSSSANWDYQVPVDSVLWTGPSFFDIGNTTNTSTVIAPPIDSVGVYEFGIHILDDFGCMWDTVTTLEVVQTPVVELGENRELCEATSVRLDAGNETPTATYIWSPTGETTREIDAQAPNNSASEITYEVLVTEYNGSIYCYGRDSVKLIVHPAAYAAFTSASQNLEGCEPLRVDLVNTSTNGVSYQWIVGDQTSTDVNPSFVLPYGDYDVVLKVETEHGCQDSVRLENLIHVYNHPIADFGWEPNNPSASAPVANLINLTEPDAETNQYHWTIQTNKNSETDVENVFGKSPSYTWYPQSGETVAGDYLITLDAYSVNYSPSGNIYECHDTITRTITIINDNLMFPTVVTPNGDGINDIFEIHNLIDGQAFPDNELSIYNRYGKRIYFVQNLRHESEFWDPEATNTPSGTYFYRFIGRGPIRDVEFKGSIEVLR